MMIMNNPHGDHYKPKKLKLIVSYFWFLKKNPIFKYRKKTMMHMGIPSHRLALRTHTGLGHALKLGPFRFSVTNTNSYWSCQRTKWLLMVEDLGCSNNLSPNFTKCAYIYIYIHSSQQRIHVEEHLPFVNCDTWKSFVPTPHIQIHWWWTPILAASVPHCFYWVRNKVFHTLCVRDRDLNKNWTTLKDVTSTFTTSLALSIS